jgi:hypothetical protein
MSDRLWQVLAWVWVLVAPALYLKQFASIVPLIAKQAGLS